MLHLFPACCSKEGLIIGGKESPKSGDSHLDQGVWQHYKGWTCPVSPHPAWAGTFCSELTGVGSSSLLWGARPRQFWGWATFPGLLPPPICQPFYKTQEEKPEMSHKICMIRTVLPLVMLLFAHSCIQVSDLPSQASAKLSHHTLAFSTKKNPATVHAKTSSSVRIKFSGRQQPSGDSCIRQLI